MRTNCLLTRSIDQNTKENIRKGIKTSNIKLLEIEVNNFLKRDFIFDTEGSYRSEYAYKGMLNYILRDCLPSDQYEICFMLYKETEKKPDFIIFDKIQNEFIFIIEIMSCHKGDKSQIEKKCIAGTQ